MKKANQVWEIVYPVLMYYATISIGILVAQLVFGSSNESYMLCKIIGSLITIPVVYQDYKIEKMFLGQISEHKKFRLQKEDKQKNTASFKESQIVFTKESMINCLWIIFISITISISLNNIICMSPLVTASSEFENASNALYGSKNLPLELLGSALITPFLEEMLHRGVVYNRLRRRGTRWSAILLSSLIFAILHFNIVQFTYAFLLGIVLAIFMEKTKYLYAPVLAHITANAIAVIRTETGFLQSTVDGSVSAWLISFGLLLIGISGVIAYMKKE